MTIAGLATPQHLPPKHQANQASGMYAMCTRAILARPKATGTFASYPTDMLGKKTRMAIYSCEQWISIILTAIQESSTAT